MKRPIGSTIIALFAGWQSLGFLLLAVIIWQRSPLIGLAAAIASASAAAASRACWKMALLAPRLISVWGVTQAVATWVIMLHALPGANPDVAVRTIVALTLGTIAWAVVVFAMAAYARRQHFGVAL